MSEYRLISDPRADLAVEAAFQWYENERQGLGLEFLDELRAAYKRIADGPLKYQHLRSGIRCHAPQALSVRRLLRYRKRGRCRCCGNPCELGSSRVAAQTRLITRSSGCSLALAPLIFGVCAGHGM